MIIYIRVDTGTVESSQDPLINVFCGRVESVELGVFW